MSESESFGQLNRTAEDFDGSPAANSPPPIADEGLGSLAQSARKSHLGSARMTLFAIGILTIVANLLVMAAAQTLVEKQFADEVQQLQQQGQELDMQIVEDLKQTQIRSAQLVAAGFAGVGVIFLFLGALIYKYPVPCTVLALVLYIAGQAISGLFDPSMLAKGLVVKIIFIVALVKAMQAALAYRREQAASAS